MDNGEIIIRLGRIREFPILYAACNIALRAGLVMVVPYDIPQSWQHVAESLVTSGARRLLVVLIGASDSGKSTLAAYLASRLHEFGRRTAVVDCDLGQSNIGPPGAISMGFLSSAVTRLEQVPAVSGYFVGSISPVGHLLATVVGTRLMVDRARAMGAEAIIVDTSGLILDNIGRELKLRKIEVLQPTHVVALARQDELSPLVNSWRAGTWPLLLEVQPSFTARQRSPEERRAYRQICFRRYFQDARSVMISLNQIAMVGTCLGQGVPLPERERMVLERILQTPVLHVQQLEGTLFAITAGTLDREVGQQIRTVPEFAGIRYFRWVPSAQLSGLLLGLCDQRGFMLGLGLLQDLDLMRRHAQVLTPVRELERVRSLRFGNVRLQPNGTQLQTLPPGVF
jgi:polynucleotide 5'-hydroxyl-kinase GRC3/NOL9